jgi:hypothetical protein
VLKSCYTMNWKITVKLHTSIMFLFYVFFSCKDLLRYFFKFEMIEIKWFTMVLIHGIWIRMQFFV